MCRNPPDCRILAWQYLPLICLLVLARVGHGAEASVSRDPHPLDRALAIASEGLDHMHENVHDYTATMIKRERIDDKLSEHQYLSLKIRHRQENDGKIVVPFSVYLRFQKPLSWEGREAIWVEGRNNGKLIAHDSGFKNILRYHLDPDGVLATMGNRYSIKDTGFMHLVEELVKKGEEDRKHDEIEVKVYRKTKVDGRSCTLIQVVHPQKRPYFDYYRARIFIDDELNVPIRYSASSWPKTEGGKPVLEEEYTYRNVRLNVGLTDKDFDPDNPAYDFP